MSVMILSMYILPIMVASQTGEFRRSDILESLIIQPYLLAKVQSTREFLEEELNSEILVSIMDTYDYDRWDSSG